MLSNLRNLYDHYLFTDAHTQYHNAIYRSFDPGFHHRSYFFNKSNLYKIIQSCLVIRNNWSHQSNHDRNRHNLHFFPNFSVFPHFFSLFLLAISDRISNFIFHNHALQPQIQLSLLNSQISPFTKSKTRNQRALSNYLQIRVHWRSLWFNWGCHKPTKN